ncbi:MAG: S-layer homology domain-containing protein [Oscillospiraceae bacterium]|nr:S-layer homology domain-containing protein [Oscillospiraceae bacterium]
MKKKQILSLILTLILVHVLCLPAFASSWSELTDVSEHWAAQTLEKGFADGLIQGFDDSTLRPDEPITGAQMITVLCRVINAPEVNTAAPSSVPGDAWFASYAASALSLGLISADIENLDAPMARQEAFSILARAFSLVPAAPNTTVLNSFADSGDIKDENRKALSSLVELGIAEGYGGILGAEKSITRAEFMTLLYRVVESYCKPTQAGLHTNAGMMLNGSGTLNSLKSENGIWFDCNASNVSLNNVKAERLSLLSRDLKELMLSGGSLKRLVLCGGDARISSKNGCTIETLQIDGALNAALSSCAANVEITGNSSNLSLAGEYESLVITGKGNTVTLAEGCSVKKLVVAGSENTLRSEGENTAASLELSGSDNNVSIIGEVTQNVSLNGNKIVASLNSSAPLESAAIDGNGSWLTLDCGDIGEISVSGSYNTVHKQNAGTAASLDISGSNCAIRIFEGSVLKSIGITGKENALTLDGSAESITVDGRSNTIDGAGQAQSVTVNSGLCNISVSVASLTDNSFKNDSDRVLALVSCRYEGNYTLEWAQEHDYDDYDKEVFVNAKGYNSDTDYLIWASLAMQRVNIFEGSVGEWKLIRSCIVGSGAPQSPTPVGVYKTTYKQAAGWTTSTYTCSPVVGFYQGTGYAFHSRLYYPRSNVLTDARIGFPVSHGCFRMYDEDIQYIYDTIPKDTTVVVY